MSGKLDIIIEQGADFERGITINDANSNAVDLTGNTFRGQMRKKYSSADVTATFTVLAVAGSESQGKVSMKLDDSVTETLKAGDYVYDIEWIQNPGAPNEIITRLLEGTIIVTPEVTR